MYYHINIYCSKKTQGSLVLSQNRKKKFTMIFMHINVKIIFFFKVEIRLSHLRYFFHPEIHSSMVLR